MSSFDLRTLEMLLLQQERTENHTTTQSGVWISEPQNRSRSNSFSTSSTLHTPLNLQDGIWFDPLTNNNASNQQGREKSGLLSLSISNLNANSTASTMNNTKTLYSKVLSTGLAINTQSETNGAHSLGSSTSSSMISLPSSTSPAPPGVAAAIGSRPVNGARRNANRYKTELCRAYQESGNCQYMEKCQFAHGPSELRTIARHPKYKTDLCRTYHMNGFCPYGTRCHFIHGLDELIKSPAHKSIQKSFTFPDASPPTTGTATAAVTPSPSSASSLDPILEMVLNDDIASSSFSPVSLTNILPGLSSSGQSSQVSSSSISPEPEGQSMLSKWVTKIVNQPDLPQQGP